MTEGFAEQLKERCSVLNVDVEQVDAQDDPQKVNRRLKEGWKLLDVGRVNQGEYSGFLYILGWPKSNGTSDK